MWQKAVGSRMRKSSVRFCEDYLYRSCMSFGKQLALSVASSIALAEEIVTSRSDGIEPGGKLLVSHTD